MSDPVPFLMALGQAFAAGGLYEAGHPARLRAHQGCADSLAAMLETSGPTRFTFLGGEVVHGRRILRELRQWEWGARLATIGIERLEFHPPVTRGELEEFLAEVLHALQAPAESQSGLSADPPIGIRYGRVAIATDAMPAGDQPGGGGLGGYDLGPEVEAIAWIRQEVAGSDRLPVLEAETIVRSLALAMARQGDLVLPLLELQQLDQYAVTHASNVAVLTMGLAEYLGYAPREGRALGVAALLADIGTTRIARELLTQPGVYSEPDRRRMEAHCAEGARLLLERHPRMELAAVVAYEHHLDLDGTGYPELLFPRPPHFASRLVRICDVYDAATSPRPWRDTLSPEEALGLLEAGAGNRFDPALVVAFATMLRQARVRRLGLERPVLEAEPTDPAPGTEDAAGGAPAG